MKFSQCGGDVITQTDSSLGMRHLICTKCGAGRSVSMYQYYDKHCTAEPSDAEKIEQLNARVTELEALVPKEPTAIEKLVGKLEAGVRWSKRNGYPSAGAQAKLDLALQVQAEINAKE